MARRFRRTTKQRKPLDWVTTFSGYNLEAAPLLSVCNFPPDSFPLTGWADILDSAGGDGVLRQHQFPQLEQTVTRVRGSVFCWISPADSWWDTLTGIAYMKVRIVKMKQFMSPAVVDVLPQEDIATLFNPQAGNVEFLWEHTEQFLAQSAWGSLVVDPSNYVKKIDVDVTVKRRLQRNELLAIQFQYIGKNFSGDPLAFPDGFFDWEVRTLLQTIT